MRRALIATLILCSSCSYFVDKRPQCVTDDDCVRFGGRPYCRLGACVPSGLGPQGCIAGAPKSQSDYLNACTTAACVPFDNCARIGLCSADTMPAPTVDPMNGAIPPLVNPVATPTVNCSDAGSPRIYMYGTSDFAPLLRAVQPLLTANAGHYRAIYQNATSCQGVVAAFDATKRTMSNPAAGATPNYAFYFDDSGKQISCLLDSTGNTIDVGVSNLFSTTCNTAYVAGTTVGDYTGPVVPFVLAVASGSTQDSISAEAAHIVFGLGGKTNGVNGLRDAAPWTDPTYYFIRNGNAGSTVLTAQLIGVPKAKFWGIDRLSTDNLRDSMLTSPVAEQSIGILSIDYADKNRSNLRSLYLQATGQTCGYLPDSTKNVFDKRNVRDGHYPLWGYVHFFAPIGPGGVPSDAAKALIARLSVARLDQSLLDNVIGASLVPQCAMSVARSGEESDYTTRKGVDCGCYFDFKTTNRTDCIPCDSSTDCPAARPTCNYGYCELN